MIALTRSQDNVEAINKGSVVHLDYLPDVGTRVIVDGQERITIPGEDFFRASFEVLLDDRGGVAPDRRF